MAALPDDLRVSLEQVLRPSSTQEIARSVERLIERYRRGTAATEPILRSPTDVAAYAAYRMPATFAAVRAALARVAEVAPEFRPRTHVDVGGGTGAAVWAAAETWPSLESAEVLEQVSQVMTLGRRLAEGAEAPVVRGARWRRYVVGPGPTLPEADLVTMSYVLGELPEAHRAGIVREMAARGGVVALFEPGTPAGHQRVLAARELLVEQGMTVLAPCPHSAACPISGGEDWCHFAARVTRSVLHRQVKAASLGYEDEKFSYVVAARTAWAPAEGRVVRHPLRRKGLVSLRVCTADGGLTTETVSKRHGETYRRARDLEWGDAWPPVGEDG
ncbi:Ribosomal protein RSM22 (predicted rRNA methylase) [Streptoalloteichus tenebrarius]|uniref:Ribosomal protein RSM22 (Predicted rRNA methylase) n=1 Tax=Streptoalloteichus tenebrarius (strain ATCC 17920 / DSM 40477 / JCM 4838 / CBS 697.72 / NBRC 16177 / NCIMB 11028 / NRRL B-12390 / A12253. 1 / ISP 5477) TaxID=1933 RepID=A0ABT1HTM1_STRSD|nr:small ribosomal subunit Rsm22 family protein [Streptoalloteichus tenebrarius]MCP2258770.1 Ribosomal protein RSM22 (predicted rRNA methylase) [Streptoalloteichus tenebrarius]BFE99553.1 small ribosomal subunit Rsm22 family protein [Streptoalloteichus tenebrarius]